jgi:hypothetical protein
MAHEYFIAKLYRNHNSVVMAVPQPVTIALGLRPGNHVLLQWNGEDGKFTFQKFVPIGAKDGRDTEHTDSQDRSGATQAAVGG